MCDAPRGGGGDPTVRIAIQKRKEAGVPQERGGLSPEQTRALQIAGQCIRDELVTPCIGMRVCQAEGLGIPRPQIGAEIYRAYAAKGEP